MAQIVVGWDHKCSLNVFKEVKWFSLYFELLSLKISFPVLHDVHTKSYGGGNLNSSKLWPMELLYMQHVLRVGCMYMQYNPNNRDGITLKHLFLNHRIASRRYPYIELKIFQYRNHSHIYRIYTILCISECWYNVVWYTILMFYYNNINRHA
jgi:hypothetical protein